MTYKCPLCLTPLSKDVSFERYCVKHPGGAKEFKCDRRTLRKEIYCSEPGDNCNETTEDGVFFRHIGCTYLNPFWNPDKKLVEVPVQPEETSATYQTDFGRERVVSVVVQHWLLGKLALLPKNTSEMWFPSMLLRATAETSSFRKRVGVLVELAGAQESGKTILAMMSMNQNGYTLVNGPTPEIEVRDFIYSSHKEGNQAEFLRYVETLHLASLLRDGQRKGLFLPQGTFRGRSVKVSFIKPSKNLQVSSDDGVYEDSRWPKRFAMRGWFAATKAVQGLASQTSLVFWQLLHEATSYPFWYTVILYDTSGEANEKQDVQRELDAIDKVAIVVNGGEIFGLAKKANVAPEEKVRQSSGLKEESEPELGGVEDQSIKTAWDRIAKGVDRKQKLYLVITQMDRIKAHIEPDWKRVEVIADGIGSRKLNREAKRMLSEWLGGSSAPHAADLRSKLRLVKDVFFVWTEDLPKSLTPAPETQGKMPRSRGLAKFICDCLDVKTSQITK